MSEHIKRLADLRAQIDRIDEELVVMLNKRAALALEAKAAKGNTAMAIYRPEREIEFIRHVVASNRGPLSEEAMEILFREIITICRTLQQGGVSAWDV